MNRISSEDVAEAEDKGRKVVEEFLDYLGVDKNRYYFTPEQLNHIDLVFNNGKRAIEIKNRDIESEKYYTPGYMLEKTKYDALNEIPIGDYCCIFRDCIIFWDVHNITPPTFYQMKCTETTAGGTYGKKVKKKWVTDLAASEATAIFDRTTYKEIKKEYIAKQEKKKQEELDRLDGIIKRKQASGLL